MGKQIYEMSLLDLVIAMDEAETQEQRNRIILEITYRQYIPFDNKTFEELLVENGYKIIEESKNDSNNKRTGK